VFYTGISGAVSGISLVVALESYLRLGILFSPSFSEYFEVFEAYGRFKLKEFRTGSYKPGRAVQYFEG
jgi:hypothetical protein